MGIFEEVRFSESEHCLPRQNGKYQSDLFIRYLGEGIYITIFANQPVYPSDDNKSLELPPKRTYNEQCYSSFECYDIKYHKSPNKSLTIALERILCSLKNI